MYCRICGKEVLNEAIICPHCGCSLEKVPPAKEIPTPSKTNVFCILGFILACVSLIIDLLCLFSLSGFILSVIGVVRANKNNEKKGLGIAGISIGAVAFVLNLFLKILLASLFVQLT